LTSNEVTLPLIKKTDLCNIVERSLGYAHHSISLSLYIPLPDQNTLTPSSQQTNATNMALDETQEHPDANTNDPKRKSSSPTINTDDAMNNALRATSESSLLTISGIFRVTMTESCFRTTPNTDDIRTHLKIPNAATVNVRPLGDNAIEITISYAPSNESAQLAMATRQQIAETKAFQVNLIKNGPRWIYCYYWRTTPKDILETFRRQGYEPIQIEYDTYTQMAAIQLSADQQFSDILSHRFIGTKDTNILVTPLPNDQNCVKIFPMVSNARTLADNLTQVKTALEHILKKN
jgi:hypothetical protein